ncbi:hypothetical protein EDD16DRAFT_974634 [Pisolithus croceorrhizus]|nr:hypothetical protein EDD16DRAFT_974634 [Pisolithus croceorrhizus]KAI6137489.1 hypothetical protein EDD17DRAFT_448200 [Pisolithus thermaeus]
MFDNALVTMWSAPNYCYRCGNMASVLTLREGGEHDFKVFGPAPENDKDKGMGRRIVSVSPTPCLLLSFGVALIAFWVLTVPRVIMLYYFYCPQIYQNPYYRWDSRL